MIDIERTLAQV